MEIRTGSKNIVCNVWSDAARQAAIARRQQSAELSGKAEAASQAAEAETRKTKQKTAHKEAYFAHGDAQLSHQRNAGEARYGEDSEFAKHHAQMEEMHSAKMIEHYRKWKGKV